MKLNISLQQLKYAIAVSQHGTFREAAEACHVTQPTLSMQLQKLEENLGVTLFDRSRQPVVPTSIGEQILEQARIVLKESERLEEILLAEEGLIRGTFRLGVIPTLSPYIVPRFIKKFVKTYPEVHLIIEELQTDQIIEMLKLDSLDGGLLVTPLKKSFIKEEPLFYEPFYLYASHAHPLLKSKKINEDSLSPKDIFLMSEGHCFRDQVLSLCQASQAWKDQSAFQIESGNLLVLKKLIDQGNGYTLLPAMAVGELLSTADRKRLRSFETPVPHREVSLVCHRHFVKTAIFLAIKSEILASLPSDLSLKEQSGKKSFVVNLGPI